MSPTATAETTVNVTRTFQAPREEVFRAFVEPERFRRWFTPPGGHSPSAEIDLRVGGAYRVEMHLGDHVSYCVGDGPVRLHPLTVHDERRHGPAEEAPGPHRDPVREGAQLHPPRSRGPCDRAGANPRAPIGG